MGNLVYNGEVIKGLGESSEKSNSNKDEKILTLLNDLSKDNLLNKEDNQRIVELTNEFKEISEDRVKYLREITNSVLDNGHTIEGEVMYSYFKKFAEKFNINLPPYPGDFLEEGEKIILKREKKSTGGDIFTFYKSDGTSFLKFDNGEFKSYEGMIDDTSDNSEIYKYKIEQSTYQQGEQPSSGEDAETTADKPDYGSITKDQVETEIKNMSDSDLIINLNAQNKSFRKNIYNERNKTTALIQKALNSAGIEVGVDGYYGEGTINAVKKFQEKYGESVDGMFGPNSYNKLIGVLRSNAMPEDNIPDEEIQAASDSNG